MDFFQGYYYDDVFIYGRNYNGRTGYLGTGTMEATLNQYAPKWREIGDGGKQIAQYETPANAWPDQATMSQIENYLQEIRSRRQPK